MVNYDIIFIAIYVKGLGMRRSLCFGMLFGLIISGTANADTLCNTNIKNDMKPGQVKIIDCTNPNYADYCYNDAEFQAIYIDYNEDCDEAEYKCRSGYKCVEDGSYYSCKSGDGNLVCPATYTFKYRCDGLDDELKAACIECTTTKDWTAWDYENKVCGAGMVNQIQQIAKELDELLPKPSRWKNAAGNFNTARLASDSIAGVVLGTVGGVVTSNIIKKNQVKGGFQDIQCTISGQVVSEYGDEFIVGRQ